MNNLTMEKVDSHHFSQVMKFNVTVVRLMM